MDTVCNYFCYLDFYIPLLLKISQVHRILFFSSMCFKILLLPLDSGNQKRNQVGV